MHLVFVFTFDYELLTWDNSGQISRELLYFNELKSQVFKKITIVTYGDNNDLQYLSKFKNSFKINDEKSIKKIVLKKINFKQKLKIKRKLYRLGNLILKNNLKYINKFI